jgi:hypothetical protein
MPYGQTRYLPASSTRDPVIVPVAATARPPALPDATERAAGVDLWQAVTLDAAAAVWPAGLAVIDYSAAPVTRLEVFATNADELVIGLDRTPSYTAGGFDLFHPGGGQLVEPIPPTRRVYLLTATGTTPTGWVHVIGHAGAYALR